MVATDSKVGILLCVGAIWCLFTYILVIVLWISDVDEKMTHTSCVFAILLKWERV